jgi:hypothetical protein
MRKQAARGPGIFEMDGALRLHPRALFENIAGYRLQAGHVLVETSNFV